MSKIMIGAAVALIASASFAFADGMSSNQSGVSAQPVSSVEPAPGQVVCHHDGEIIQGPNGQLLCHMRPQSGVHFKSADWYRALGAKAATTNQ